MPEPAGSRAEAKGPEPNRGAETPAMHFPGGTRAGNRERNDGCESLQVGAHKAYEVVRRRTKRNGSPANR
ncbi:hypothetical protein GCM10023335_07000 [Streptomyces siamensis]|uniref:Uncharacterized protein n=1 Tax=Streptomyces siamensis TaxID=1274986 RepID=A0ABP9IGT8_9ACTN